MNLIHRAFLAGKVAAEATFKAVPPPTPSKAPTPQQQKLPTPPKPPPLPSATPRPSLAPLPPPSPAQAVSSQVAAMKLSQFNFHCTPPARPNPDDIQPDNGLTYKLKDNAMDPLDRYNAIAQAFSSIDVPAPAGNNPDILDSGLAGPPSPWDM